MYESLLEWGPSSERALAFDRELARNDSDYPGNQRKASRGVLGLVSQRMHRNKRKLEWRQISISVGTKRRKLPHSMRYNRHSAAERQCPERVQQPIRARVL